MSTATPHLMLVNGSLFGGGAEHVMATLARHLRGMGYRITIAVIHRGGEVKTELEHEGFEVLTELAAGTYGTSTRLKALVDARSVDIVHSHDVRSLVDAGLCRLRSRVAHVHTFHFGNYPHLPSKHLWLEGVFARVPDQLIAVGDVQRETIIKTLHLRGSRIHTVWNGVDRHTGGTPGVSTTPAADDVPLVGSMSTLGPQKGVPTLLDAAALLRERGVAFRLLIVGEGDMRPQLEAQTARLGLQDCVTFAGWRPDAATALLPTFDIFVQSSYWEAMSVVILEAMAAGKPIVATTVGENPLVLADNRTALLVPPRDAEALATGLATAIRDAALRRRLGTAAQNEYVQTLTGSAMAKRYDAVYRSTLARRVG